MQMYAKSYEGNEGQREMLLGQQKMYCILGLIGFIMLFDGLLLSKCEAHNYDFFLQETNYTRLCSTKRILTVNGNFPGPTIKVRKGDTFYVNVHNEGTYGVTIHWHGVKQPRNPWYDGPENITQCPIKPGSNFTYKVILSTEEGTLWWHAHSDWTRATIHGAIIILPALETTYPFPNPRAEETIIIGSWHKGDVMAVIDDALATGGSPNVSDAFTINGQPGDLYPCSSSSTYRLLVDYGNLYLLRIINAVLNEDQFFGIARHKLLVVGQDGAYIKPITTDYIMITPGQTMDVLVRAEQLPSFYYMASTPFFDNNIVPFDNTTTTAIFQYRSSRTHPSSIPFPSLPSYNDIGAAMRFTRRVRSLATKKYPIQVPLKIAKRLFITVSVNELLCPNASCAGPNGMRISASLNNVSFVTPRIDILQAYYRGLKGAVFEDDFPSVPPYYFNFTGDSENVSVFTKRGTKVKMLNYGEAVEIVFQGTNLLAPESHPMHLHGYSFYKVGTGPGNFKQRTDPRTYNLIDPPHINTISVPKNGWTAVRFYADNPGVWFMHCHLERHASWGMETVLIVKNGPTKLTSIRPPPSYMPPCS